MSRATAKANLRSVPLDDGLIEGRPPPLVPAGIYVARYLSHETALAFGKALKLFVHFELVELGPHQGKRLFRAYNLAGQPGKGGRFRASWRSDLVREVAIVLGHTFRPDRINLRDLRNRLVRVRVRVVDRDYRQREIPPALRYAIVAELVGLEVGSTQ